MILPVGLLFLPDRRVFACFQIFFYCSRDLEVVYLLSPRPRAILLQVALDKEAVGGALLLFAAVAVCGVAALAVGYQVILQPWNEIAPKDIFFFFLAKNTPA